VYVGQLPAGTYQVTFVMHQPEAFVAADSTVVKAFKKTFRCSFTVQ
jgi:hypothetical protein